MKRSTLLIVCFLLGVPFAPALDVPALKDIPYVELRAGQTSTPDGFNIRVSAGPQWYTPPGKTPGEMLWVTLSVPQKVGNNSLTGGELMVQDSRNRTILAVPLSPSGKPTAHTPATLSFCIQRQYTKRAEVQLHYGEPPFGNLAKVYTVPCAQLLPAKP